jgi:DNA-binding transcriptional LysR family regulator
VATDRLRELEVFLGVVEAGNFSAAARRMNCSPSAVSKLIERLEARTGARLLQRTTRSVSLTQEGRALALAARKVLDALVECEAATGDASAARGTIRVHTTLTFSEQQLAPLLSEFLDRHPELRIEFLLTSDPVGLVTEDVDVSIQAGVALEDTRVVKRIGTTGPVLCAAPRYVQKFGTPFHPDDLARHHCLNFLPHSPRSIWHVRAGDAAVPMPVSGRIASNSEHFLRVLACQGLGIAKLADFHVARDLREGRLLPILESFPLNEPVPILAVLPSNRHMTARLRLFLRFLEQRLERVARSGADQTR